jgi:hypothetical protein
LPVHGELMLPNVHWQAMNFIFGLFVHLTVTVEHQQLLEPTGSKGNVACGTAPVTST